MKHNTNLFTILTKIIVVILPFYVFIAVYLWDLTGINNIWILFKEWLLVLIFLALIYEFFKAKKIPKFDILDYLVFFYIIYWVWITIVNWLWLNSIFHWGRYDFMFLVVLLIYKHWAEFLKATTTEILKLFLYSWAWALLFSFLLKFRLKEEFLIEFWYINYVSDWTFEWWIPIYHWLENSWIRRFQWIFDWPSAMAYFLIIFSATFLYFQKKKWEFYVIVSMMFFLWLLVLTYSRSAMLWVWAAIWLLILLNFKYIFHKLKKYIVQISAWLIIVFWTFAFLFQDQLTNIIFRESSTSGHFERMAIWIERFYEKPLWAWLAESWPAYRNIYPEKQTREDEVYYIPESWFIQVLTEWWIIFFLTFLSILWVTLVRLYWASQIYFWVLIAIIVMNIFLHTFETTYLSILLFIFIWLLISKK